MTAPAGDPAAAAFVGRFGGRPAFRVRAPGRVNLIGEHIDYNGLSVLPMAITRCVTVAARPRADATVRFHSLTPGFAPCEFALGPDIPPYPVGHWGNYVKAAAQSLVRSHGIAGGVEAVLTSTVPTAAGLSSSSALVIGVALTMLAANRVEPDPVALAEEMAQAERYTGTQGGGMDQAICLGATAGTASRVDFDPLRLTPVPMPGDWRVVIAYSLRRAEKSGAAQQTYNRRTAECREALAIVAGALGHDGRTVTYRDLLAAHPADDLVRAGQAALGEPLVRRFRHVVTEADRVRQAESALRAGDLGRFGTLLSASHASLRDDYEVSSPALDELVTLAEAAGAAGARLTGAGMGGCMIAATRPDQAGSVMDRLRAGFYDRHAFEGPLDDHLFVAEPAGSAAVEPAT